MNKILVGLIVGVNVQAEHEERAKPATNAVFEQLKSLEGTWDATMLKPDGDKTTVSTGNANETGSLSRYSNGEREPRFSHSNCFPTAAAASWWR